MEVNRDIRGECRGKASRSFQKPLDWLFLQHRDAPRLGAARDRECSDEPAVDGSAAVRQVNKSRLINQSCHRKLP